MMMKTLFSLLIALVLVSTPVWVGAEEEGSGSSSGSNSSSSTGSTKKTTAVKAEKSIRDQLKTEKDARKKALESFKGEKDKTRQLAKVKEAATKMMDERTKAAERLKAGEQTKKCSAAAKADVLAALAKIEARLKGDKTQVDAATTVDEVKSIVTKEIIGENYFFRTFMPAARTMCAANDLITKITDRIGPAITKVKDAGVDVTEIEPIVAQAKTGAQEAYDLAKKAANNPTDSASLKSAKAKLAEAKRLLNQAKEKLGLSSTKKSTTDTPTSKSTDTSSGSTKTE